ncbi:MAG: glycosyltransferase family 4 protein [Planctomycetes bacterium]|nr:glycosyltransferase family 4 protein [Planctomycetota bacterium]
MVDAMDAVAAEPRPIARPESPGPARDVVYLCRFAGLARGGAERQALLLARRLRECGVRIEVVAEDAREQNGEPLGSECRVLLRTPRARHASTMEFWRRVATRLWRRRHEVGVLHLVGIDSEKVAFVPFAKRLGMRTVVKIMLTGDGGDFENLGRGLERRMKLATLRRVDRFVAVSRRIERDLVSVGISPERIVYVPNGVDVNRDFPHREPARLALREIVPLRAGETMVLSAGRLVPQKAFVELIRAFAPIAASRSHVRLVVLGDGPERSAILAEAAKLGIGDRVAIPGHVADPSTFLAAADLFVLGSRSEGLSNALLEAMAARLPVVATRTSGTEDAVRDSIDGLLVEPGDGEALGAALSRLIDSPDRRTAMGNAARERVRQSFSIEATVEAHRRLYAELTNLGDSNAARRVEGTRPIRA